jgi:hypothetical protein
MTPTNSTVTLVVFREQGRLTLEMPVASRAQFE